MAHLPSQTTCTTPHLIVTPQSLTYHLAYLHHYTPKRLPRGQFIAPKHLRHIAAWIGHPLPHLFSLRQHLILSAHFALLHAASLINHQAPTLQPTATARTWLTQPRAEQISQLLTPLRQPAQWQQSLRDLGLQETITLDYTTYLGQMLDRQQQWSPRTDSQPATWLSAQDETWCLQLPADIPPSILFDLLQLGHWQPDSRTLLCTPLTIASEPSAALGYDHICWLLETATQTPLATDRQDQLHSWLNRAHTYRLRGALLSTAQPGQLQAICANRRLRPYLLEQIGPRHALVHPDLAPRLRKWLVKQGYPLDSQPPYKEDLTPTSDPIYHWLGLRLLIGLQKYLPLPCRAPHEELFQLSQTLPDETGAIAETLAQQILSGLDTVIQGRDAFFPAYQTPPSYLSSLIEEAICLGHTLRIAYRAVGQPEARWHEIEPLRLEQKNQLTYLTAYSYRAEANLTFRLDRVKEIVTESQDSTP